MVNPAHYSHVFHQGEAILFVVWALRVSRKEREESVFRRGPEWECRSPSRISLAETKEEREAGAVVPD
jgi:hypothetical protein